MVSLSLYIPSKSYRIFLASLFVIRFRRLRRDNRYEDKGFLENFVVSSMILAISLCGFSSPVDRREGEMGDGGRSAAGVKGD